MARNAKLRISIACEAGVRTVWVNGAERKIDYHANCTGMEDRRVGRNFKCKCWCHKPRPKTYWSEALQTRVTVPED